MDPAPPDTTDAPAPEWVSAREAGRIAGIPEKQVPQAARRGLLDTKSPLPWTRGATRYGRASAVALGLSLITRATATSTACAPESQEPSR